MPNNRGLLDKRAMLEEQNQKQLKKEGISKLRRGIRIEKTLELRRGIGIEKTLDG